MLRQLLTLLAVISGFTLAAEPVSAAEVRAVSVAAAEQADCVTIVSAPAQYRQIGHDRAIQQAWPSAQATTIAPVLGVLVQVDRARE